VIYVSPMPRGGAGQTPRLLVLTPDMPPERGGIQALVAGLLPELNAFRTRVVALDSAGARAYDREHGLDVKRVRASPRLGPARNLVLNAVGLTQAFAFRPAVILCMHIVATPAALAQPAPWAVYFHANEILGKPRLAALAGQRADASIVVSAYTRELLAGAGADRARVHTIPPGVELPHARGAADAPRRPTSLAAADADGQRRPTIVTVSRLSAQYKGHDVMLAALPLVRERVPDVIWVVLGDGPLRERLQAQVRAAGLGDAVLFLGGVSDDERDAWLAAGDVFAMPSRLPGGSEAGEGFGIVFLEAAARGVPIVAGNVGGARDAVADGETGLLVDPEDERAVADAISSLLLDRDLAKRLGAAGAARARSFAWSEIGAQVQALLLELAGGGRRAGSRPS
jgi:phosphatidylinositol alpha-1,6-mannosyltransferase